MKFRNFLYILIFIQILFTKEHKSINKDLSNNRSNSVHLIGIMVEFEEDNDSQTSGNGKFLTDKECEDGNDCPSLNSNLNYIDYPNKMRCNPSTDFVIDLPPHNSTYFSLQLEAVKNYYANVSNKEISYEMVDNVFQLNHKMSYYATSDDKIGLLFADAVNMAYENGDIDENLLLNDVLFVVFHAGLGQEASQRFDPTIYDIKSAYVDSDMLDGITNDDSYWINQKGIDSGLVMPETLNWIFYDVVEEIFSLTFTSEDELENLLCGQQLGMTGLFAHLLGYHFDFPLMTNEDGRYGIGDFGLMDQGCFNQQGVIPADPNPWTSIKSGWKNSLNQTSDLFVNEDIEIIVDLDEIYQFNISEDEYFLVENRYNQLVLEDNDEYNGLSIQCIIDYDRNYCSPMCDNYKESLEDWCGTGYIEEEDQIKHFFHVVYRLGKGYTEDTVSELEDNDIFQYNKDYNVITKVKSYDYGLPGSGILIWHIKEPVNSDYSVGVNNSQNDRAVVLEEADGKQQIGGPDYDWFPGIDYTQGRSFDFWYKGNEQYEFINYDDDYEGYTNVVFDNSSIPNTRTYDNLNSYLSLDINGGISKQISITAKLDYSEIYSMEFIDEDIKIIGNSPDENCIFYIDNNSIINKRCIDEFSEITIESPFIDFEQVNDDIDVSEIDSNSRVLIKDELAYLVGSSNYYINNSEVFSFDNEPVYPIGFYSDLNSTEQVPDALSLGDVDQDGYDERLTIDANNTLHCYNSNDTYCPGFPVYGLFKEIPLIVDLINESSGPEIIVKNGSYISIISNDGQFLLNIPSYDDFDLQIIPDWGDENKACLINGNRLFIFDDFNEDQSYWYNYYSTSYNYPLVSGPAIRNNEPNENNLGIDLNRTYNYPNPIEEGFTRFRFYVYNATKVSVKIYDSLGFLIKALETNSLLKDEYNEIYWDASSVDSGLYFAEVYSDYNESKLIKIVVIK